MKSNYITLKFFSVSSWKDEDIKSLLLLLDGQTMFRPEKWGPYEPLKFEFSQHEIVNILARWKSEIGSGFLLGKREHGFSITINKNLQFKKPNWISIFLDEDFFINEQHTKAFLDFAIQLFEWGNMIYGYACHRDDFERKNKLSVPTRIEGKLIATGGMDIKRCLPGIYWANFFGGEYVEWFGTHKFKDLPAHTFQELPNQGQLVLVAGSPLDYMQKIVIERELSIRRILGNNAFFDIQNPTLVANSPFEQGFIPIE